MIESTYNWELLSLYGPVLLKLIAQVAILVAIIYLVYSRFIQHSHADRLLKGLFVILLSFVALWVGARLLDFQLLQVVFGSSIHLIVIGLIVIFQPELRRMLLYLGQADWFGLKMVTRGAEERKAEYLIRELTEAVRYMARTKTGALIVLEHETPSGIDPGAYLEAGTPLEARLSSELLLTIFHANAPLHDGAVVIGADNRITAAGVLLPLTEDPNLSWSYGTRHRAAIGVSEVTNNHCIVVSEETGNISLVHRGALEKMTSVDALRHRLEEIYQVTRLPKATEKADSSTAGRRSRRPERRLSELLPEGLPKPLHQIVQHLQAEAGQSYDADRESDGNRPSEILANDSVNSTSTSGKGTLSGTKPLNHEGQGSLRPSS
ncbi:MAG: diadenylate cyclase CdaA [Candidatus Melainabacteria bacterium]|nr:diadenylate cyclase CdaA [Candidatus Melainabacteria bacterium]